MAQSSVTRAFEPAGLRSVFVKVRPVPRRLAERRAILRTLQRYGEIEVFQPLTDPAAFNAIATKAITVQHLVINSPLQFDYVPEPPATTTYQEDLAATGGVPRDIHGLHRAMDNKSGGGSSRQSFVLNIFPSDTEHRYQIQKSPLYGPWPEDSNRPKSLVAEALKKVVPADMAAKGLRDWETGGQALRMFDRGHPDRSSLVETIIERRVVRRRDRQATEEGRSRGNLLQTFKE